MKYIFLASSMYLVNILCSFPYPLESQQWGPRGRRIYFKSTNGEGCVFVLCDLLTTGETDEGRTHTRWHEHPEVWQHLAGKLCTLSWFMSQHRERFYSEQEATVRTGHGTTDWFQIGKGARQSCILSPCLFSLYAEYIMRNAGLEEAQAGIKIVKRNINNLRYADDTTLMEKVKRN